MVKKYDTKVPPRYCPACHINVMPVGKIGGYVNGMPTLVCSCGRRVALPDVTSDTMVSWPKSRKEAIYVIDKEDRRQQFTKTFRRTPEAYFEEYAAKEPGIWRDVLNDLQVK